MNKHEVIRYYRWGNEKPGYVSTWQLGEDGSIKHRGQIRREDLPEGAIFDCPYN